MLDDSAKGHSARKRSVANHPWELAALALLTILLAANLKLLNGKAAPLWDAGDLFAPYFTLIADHARAGRVLLWEPWTSGGTPANAEPEFGSFSPVTILVGAVTGGSESGFRIYWLLIWFLGPLGILFLARHFSAPPWGAFIVAIGFAFSGLYTGMAEHTPMLYSIAFLPFFLCRLDVALLSHRLMPAAEAGALWGLSALAGYPALTILSGGFVLLWAAGRLCLVESAEDGQTRRSGRSSHPGITRRRIAFTVIALALFSFIGTIILSPAYVGFFKEAHGYSDRVGVRPRQEAVENQALHPGALATFASPFLSILQLYNPRLWEMTDVTLSSVYMGASIPILAILALAAQPRSRWRWWLASLGVFFLLCALGKHVPLRGWLYDLLPPMRYFRAAALIRVYAMFSMALLALFATKDLQLSRTEILSPIRRRFLLIATGVATAAIVAYASVMSSVDNVPGGFRRPTVRLCVVWLGAIAVSLAFFSRSRKTSLPLLFGSLALMDAVLSFGLSTATIYDTGLARRWWDRINNSHSSLLDLRRTGLNRDLHPAEWLGPPILNDRNIPLRVATFENYAPLGNRFQAELVDAPTISAMSTGEQRIWFSNNVAAVAPTDAAFAALIKRSESLGAPVFVIHSRSEILRGYKAGEVGTQDAQDIEAISNLPAAQRVTASVLRYSLNELSIDVYCPDNGWLLVTDRWSPGWQARVNGKRTDILGGNFIFRAVPVLRGTNEVGFSYYPAGWPGLFTLSWATMFGVFVGPIVKRVFY